MKVKHWVIACAGLLLASCEKDVKVEVKDVQQDIDNFVNRVVPAGLLGEGKKYYKNIVISPKSNLLHGVTIHATLYVSDDMLEDKAYEASLWSGQEPETHLHTWDLLQTRIAHTKELMNYLMKLNGDVEDESMPSKFNYEVVVMYNDFEMGRRTKLCSEFGLFHLPKVSGPYFSQDQLRLDAKRQVPE